MRPLTRLPGESDCSFFRRAVEFNSVVPIDEAVEGERRRKNRLSSYKNKLKAAMQSPEPVRTEAEKFADSFLNLNDGDVPAKPALVLSSDVQIPPLVQTVQTWDDLDCPIVLVNSIVLCQCGLSPPVCNVCNRRNRNTLVQQLIPKVNDVTNRCKCVDNAYRQSDTLRLTRTVLVTAKKVVQGFDVANGYRTAAGMPPAPPPPQLAACLSQLESVRDALVKYRKLFFPVRLIHEERLVPTDSREAAKEKIESRIANLEKLICQRENQESAWETKSEIHNRRQKIWYAKKQLLKARDALCAEVSAIDGGSISVMDESARPPPWATFDERIESSKKKYEEYSVAPIGENGYDRNIRRKWMKIARGRVEEALTCKIQAIATHRL